MWMYFDDNMQCKMIDIDLVPNLGRCEQDAVIPYYVGRFVEVSVYMKYRSTVLMSMNPIPFQFQYHSRTKSEGAVYLSVRYKG
jgi:hypothetical protein